MQKKIGCTLGGPQRPSSAGQAAQRAGSAAAQAVRGLPTSQRRERKQAAAADSRSLLGGADWGLALHCTLQRR